jgi:hypothetical protein
MAIAQGATNSFKVALASGGMDFTTPGASPFKIALYTANASLGPETTAYTTVGEVTGGDYVAGGVELTITQVPTIGNQTSSTAAAYWSFANVSWTGAITARAALIYRDYGGGSTASVCVLDFGSDKTSANTFTVQFPTATYNTAILRIA